MGLMIKPFYFNARINDILEKEDIAVSDLVKLREYLTEFRYERYWYCVHNMRNQPCKSYREYLENKLWRLYRTASTRREFLSSKSRKLAILLEFISGGIEKCRFDEPEYQKQKADK